MIQNLLEERIELVTAKVVDTKTIIEESQMSKVLFRLQNKKSTIQTFTTFLLTYSNGEKRKECVKNGSLLYNVYNSMC